MCVLLESDTVLIRLASYRGEKECGEFFKRHTAMGFLEGGDEIKGS